MPQTLRLLVAEGEPLNARETRRRSVGRSSGETFLDVLRQLEPSATVHRVKPSDRSKSDLGSLSIIDYDAVFLTGSPLHLWKETPEARRQIDFMRSVFKAATPAFGSCAGLQVACIAAGGSVRAMATPESGFARRIAATVAGQRHALLDGRPAAYDAPAVHTDEVEALPPGATLLATNSVSTVQAAEVRCGEGVFWGTQYHPEISLFEVASALRRQGRDLVRGGFAKSEASLRRHVRMIERLHKDPHRPDLAWQLGLDAQVTEFQLRTREIRNFLMHLVPETKNKRGRD